MITNNVLLAHDPLALSPRQTRAVRTRLPVPAVGGPFVSKTLSKLTIACSFVVAGIVVALVVILAANVDAVHGVSWGTVVAKAAPAAVRCQFALGPQAYAKL